MTLLCDQSCESIIYMLSLLDFINFIS